jgi:hypothetical protein
MAARMNGIRRMSFRLAPRLWIRLALGFGTLLAMMLAVVVVAVLQLRAFVAHGDHLLQQDLPHMLRLQALAQHAQGHGHAMARLLTAPRPEREGLYTAIDSEYARVGDVLRLLEQELVDPESAHRLQSLARHRASYREVFLDVAAAIESDDVSDARTMFNQIGQAALKTMLDASQELLAHEQAQLEARQGHAQEQVRRAEWLLAALAACALGLSALLAWRTTASVARPLRRVELAGTDRREDS